MAKKQLLATWIYTGGEMARQRLEEKLPAAAFTAGLLLLGLVAWRLFWSSSHPVQKVPAWIMIVLPVLIVAGMGVLGRLLPGPLFRLYKMIVFIPHEEVVITTEKIITEKKTWLLHTPERVITRVHFASGKSLYIVFCGKECQPGKRDRRFTVKLPVPVTQRTQAVVVYTHFRELLGQGPSTG